MSKATRQANRNARKVIKFTRREWNPAQLAEWAGGYGSPAVARMAKISKRRGDMVLALIKAEAVDPWRLRRALRAVEVKG